MRPLDGAAALAVIVIWGLNFVAAKIGVAQIPPLFLIAVRFALVAVLLAPFLRPLGRSWRPVIAVSVMLGGLHFGLMFTGLAGVDAGPAAIALPYSAPTSSAICSASAGESRVNARPSRDSTRSSLRTGNSVTASATARYRLEGRPAPPPGTLPVWTSR